MTAPSSISVPQRLALELQAARQSLDIERDRIRLLLDEVERLNAEVDRLRGSVRKESNSRLQAQDALNEMRERLQLAVDAANLALWDWQVGVKEIFHTARWGEMLGDIAVDGFWPIDALNKIAHPDDIKRVYASLTSLLQGQQDRAICEYRIRTPHGWMWIESHGIAAERDAQGKPTRLMGTHADISARKQAEAHWQHARELAEQASRAKSEFLANISHEVRTPLNAIMGLNHLLLDSNVDDEQRRWLQLMDRSSQTLLSLLNDVLDFSRIDSGKLNIEHIPYVLEKELWETVATYLEPAQAKGLTLSMDMAPELPEQVLGDPLRLRQVLGNLLSNAVKFTHSGGSIRVHVRSLRNAHGDGRQLQLTVADTGVGIPPEVQAHIFDAFTQADASTARQFGGSGLGLAICSRLVHLMGGGIALDSKPEQGSAFTVTLPLVAAPALASEPSERIATVSPLAPRTNAFSGLSVLLAEDNEVNELLMCQLLQQFGCRVDVARDGHEAYDRWLSGRYDLVLMDVQMPRVTGLEATRRIRATEAREGLPRTPILAVTANAMNGDQQVCTTSGMDGYVAKPVRVDALQRAIQHALNRGSHAPVDPVLAEPAAAEGSEIASPATGTGQGAPAASGLLDLFAGDVLQLRRFRERLASGLDENMVRLQTAGEQQLTSEVGASVHILNGLLGFLEAQSALRLCRGLQLAARSGDWSLYRRALPLLRSECESVLADLRKADPSVE